MSVDKFFVGYDLTGFSDNGEQRPISRVTLQIDQENVVTAGDDTGIELLAECPHATTAMVNSILAQVKGKYYKMFDAENARIDPSAELGDGVTAGRIYSSISRLSDDGNVFPNIAAPGKSELEDEYPMSGGFVMQEFNRKITETRSTITKTADEIRLEVKRIIDDVEGFGTDFSVRLDGITAQVTDIDGNVSRLQQTATSLESTIKGVSGSVSSIEQKVNNITLSVSGSLGSNASISLTVGDETQKKDLNLSNVRSAFANDKSEATISAGKITFNSGTFVLNSGNISIDQYGNLTSEEGTITGGAISGGTITGSAISGGTITNQLGTQKIVIRDGVSNYYSSDDFVGQIGTSYFENNRSAKGLVFNLDYLGSYTAWAAKQNRYENTYEVKMIYTSQDFNIGTEGFGIDTLQIDCQTVMRYKMYFGPSWDKDAGFIDYHYNRYDNTDSNLNVYALYNLILECGRGNVSVNAKALDLGNTPIINDSDVRMKTNIEESDIDALNVINNINLYSFDWIESGEHVDVGFISQQLDEEVSADFVKYDEKKDIYKINETQFIPYLVKSVQQLYNMIGENNAKPVMKSQKNKWSPYQYTLSEKMEYLERLKNIRDEQNMQPKPEPIRISM